MTIWSPNDSCKSLQIFHVLFWFILFSSHDVSYDVIIKEKKLNRRCESILQNDVFWGVNLLYFSIDLPRVSTMGYIPQLYNSEDDCDESFVTRCKYAVQVYKSTKFLDNEHMTCSKFGCKVDLSS